MSELIFVLLAALFVWSGNTFNSDYPDIEDLFPTRTLTNSKNTPNDIKNFAIDIEKLDMSKFRRKLSTYNSKINSDVKLNNTRRQTLYYLKNAEEWNNASDVLVRSKVIDLMLQLIYMARHKVKAMEDHPNYNPKETGYRIAYLHRRLQRILKRMRDIYSLIHKNMRMVSEPKKWLYPYASIILHHKAVRLHVDFVYLWWVMVRVDAAYQSKFKDSGIHDVPYWKKIIGK